MASQLSAALQFLRDNDLRTITGYLLSRDAHPAIQFLKYAICGVIATVFYLGLALLLSYTLFPAMDGMVVNGAPITDALRARNLLINNCIAFAIANVIAYVTNILFVFETGRHHPVMEFFYFTAASTLSFAISQIAGPWLVHRFGVPTIFAMATNVIASMLLNFVIRKFFVFKR